VSIHRDSCVTGANAIAASLDGSGPGSMLLRAKRSFAGIVLPAIVHGSQCSAGETLSAGRILRGPTRRPRGGAIAVRQLPTIIDFAASELVTCTSFSASVNVAVDTSGPTAAPVLNAGGAPGVAGVPAVPDVAAGFCSSPRQAATTPSRPTGA